MNAGECHSLTDVFNCAGGGTKSLPVPQSGCITQILSKTSLLSVKLTLSEQSCQNLKCGHFGCQFWLSPWE